MKIKASSIGFYSMGCKLEILVTKSLGEKVNRH